MKKAILKQSGKDLIVRCWETEKPEKWYFNNIQDFFMDEIARWEESFKDICVHPSQEEKFKNHAHEIVSVSHGYTGKTLRGILSAGIEISPELVEVKEFFDTVYAMTEKGIEGFDSEKELFAYFRDPVRAYQTDENFTVENVYNWLNEWEQLKGTAIPLRFKEHFTKQKTK